ncbi:unnamed protein product [Effrenium voratum]|nr:unnamed protein product [Effrenium voratum]CAJ1446346.1 unnamed protein product [Effrenium voratum]
MASQSPIARFFAPAKKENGSPPQTPAARVNGEFSNAQSHENACTPPSVQARKRCLTKQPDSQCKMPRIEPPRENTESEPAEPAVQPDTTVAVVPEVRDLRATLQRAEQSGMGSLPPFIAECFHHYESGSHSWPPWMRPENLRDGQGLRPSDPGYNQSTLWVPDPVKDKAEYQKAQGHNTPMLMQYWKLKSGHFDKVAFFKVGKFYEIFYYDAFICQRICGLKWMSQDKKPHVGFPEMAKHEYAKQVLAAGFKVVVVEQVERVIETNQRKSEGKQSTGSICVERAPCEVFTSGTLVDPELLQGPSARYLAYLHFEDSSRRGLDFALCLVDCATSHFQLGRFTDAADRNMLRTLLAQVQPSEVVYDVANLPREVLHLLRRLPYRPQLSPVQSGDSGLLAARDRLSKYRSAHPKAFPEEVETLLIQESAVIAAAGIMEYLTTALLSDRLLPVAVEFLIQNGELAQQLRTSLKKCIAGSKMPIDLERSTSRIWGYALQAERRAVMYEDITARRLAHFVELMEAYAQCYNLLATAFPDNLPGRLAMVARPHEKGGSLPELLPTISRLKGSVVETTAKNGAVKYRPQDGADPLYDEKNGKLEMIQGELDQELKSLHKKYPKVSFSFVHRLPGFRYEVECEENAMGAAVKSLDVTYRSKGKVRFYTAKIKELLAQIEQLEDEREDCIFPFLSKLFRDFHSHQAPFRALLRCVAEVDALLALAKASQNLGVNCRAELVATEDSAPACVELRACRHPVVAAKMGNAFVPNDTLLNCCGVPGILIVTGPNMGGKSTVLRQTCIAVILAQLGCRVSAAKCRLSPVERIFTRIGAYDAVLEGKSTLLTELEETAALLLHGSPKSLAVLDELGRGTATFDGAALASAVLTELKRVQCPVLFATHYHPVSKKAVEDTAKVAPFHMAAAVDQHQTTFLYKFLPGLCPASLGHNVAKIAGLPEQVLDEARRRSAEFQGLAGLEELTRCAEMGEEALKELFRRRAQGTIG